jgi:hypothetical protein
MNIGKVVCKSWTGVFGLLVFVIYNLHGLKYNVSLIIECFLVGWETCPQSCSLETAVYTDITWQWVYMSTASP